VVVDVRNLAVAHLDLGVEPNVGRSAAEAATAGDVNQGYDVVALLNDFVDGRSP
jgi:hypothetical protein